MHTDKYRDWADLYRTVEDVKEIRVGLKRLMARETFTELPTILVLDEQMREAAAVLRPLLIAAQQERAQFNASKVRV